MATRVIGRALTLPQFRICSASSAVGLGANILIIPAPLDPFSVSIWESPPFLDPPLYVLIRRCSRIPHDPCTTRTSPPRSPLILKDASSEMAED